MNKKYFLMAALAAGMLTTACNSSDDSPEVNNSIPQVSEQVPVGFAAYTDRGTTRSGVADDLDITALKAAKGSTTTDGGGFGVFAYYTDLKKYDQTYVPNFMYNQGVFDTNAGTGNARWEYSPLMYWPNEYGYDAQSDDEDKVTFFAYAPYVATTSAASGSVEDATCGITGFSRNTATGDPLVKFIASFDPSESVDLCWGVVGDGETSWGKIDSGDEQTMTAGLPWLNVEHPKGVEQKMKFTFKHALSQLNVQVDADPDVYAHNNGTAVVDGATKVYVRSISFTGIAMQGALNLNNTDRNTALWFDYGGSTDLPYGQSVTVKDGRRDGREGTAGADAKNETPTGLNGNIIQNSTATPGVTGELQNLFQPRTVIPADPNDAHYADSVAKALAEPVYVIPTGEAMTVTIVYDVETASPNLSDYLSDGTTHGSSIENKITKAVTFGNVEGAGLTNGKKYTLKLHLGMNSVKVDATVGAWESNTSGDAWLPSMTGEGIYNVRNPLTITYLNKADVNFTGPLATKMTITGLSVNGEPNDNIAKMNAENFSEWTLSKTGVVQIAETAAPSPSGARALTRSGVDEVAWQNSLTGVKYIQIKPIGAGTVTISAQDHDGNKSTCVVTVNAPSLTLDKSSLTLYKFHAEAGDADKGTVSVTLNEVEGIEDAINDEVSVVVTNYKYYESSSATTLSEVTTGDEALADHQNDVVTATISDGVVTVTPKGLGTATVTVSTTAGATKSFTVNVNAPTLTVSTSALTIATGKKKNLTYTARPAEDDSYTVVCKIETYDEGTWSEDNSGSVITYDRNTGIVTAAAESDATARITFNYSGHTTSAPEDNSYRDPVAECVVTVVATDPTAMKTGGGVMATNPLYKVAQFNVAKPTFESDGKPTVSSFAFQTYHSTTAQYVFSWQCATDTINAMACNNSTGTESLKGYHLPTWAEQVSIIPSDNANTSGTNIFSLGTGDPYFQFPNSITTPSTAGNSMKDDTDYDSEEELKAFTGTGYFYRHAAVDYYAVRVFGTSGSEVVTAWHYKWGAYNGVNGLKIDSYVLDTSVPADFAAAKVILNALPESGVWSQEYNESPETAASTTTSHVMRFLPACGRTDSGTGDGKGSGVATAYFGSLGYYWSATAASTVNAFNWHIGSGRMYEPAYSKTYGFSVRLFKD